MLIPIVFFFLPVLLLAALLLSLSLADATLHMLPMVTSDSPPIQTRTFFLILFAVAALFLLLCIIMGAAKFPSLSVTDKSAAPHGHIWDRYSRPVGLDARRAFVRALVQYSNPYYFPPPLSLLHWCFVRLLYLIGPSPYLEAVGRIIWRITVGPVVGVVAGIWLWNVGK
jgi:hypothetical protein